ncbi:uncharacterized protein TNCV_1247181 [Trichonephila clavipes]|uniref:Uncharacterized protein n=1 Tax=Trichonephila clavipes TaxID=2585209 RepID=A0A8X6UXC0_TRICX|nr:uncharacterized protein TNCV_1247181 [Trichonephila clavipes]
MAPWPRAPVIPQLVDRKTFRDNRWVVVVFYAAIILILVGTNIHRFRRTRASAGTSANGEVCEPKQQVVVRLDHKERAYQVSASPEDIKAEVENQETDGALV